MELQTKVEIRPEGFRVGHATGILMLGSCFTENVGEKFRYFNFDADVNPCGIVYNPLSISGVLRCLLVGRPFLEEDLMYHDGKWLSLLHHGCFSSPDRDVCLRQINERLAQGAGSLKKADLLILTFGTSWVYRNKADGKVVANCHKIPASAFERFRLTEEEIVREYCDLIGALRQVNPRLRVLFTNRSIANNKTDLLN